MSALKTTTLLFKRLLQLDMSGSGPPWPLLVWNADTARWDAVGQAARGVLYEYGPQGPEFVLTSEGDVIGVRA